MKKIPYTLGLDIGITSVGWSVLENDLYGEPLKIENLGVRIFSGAEHPKDGSSLAAPRRQARSSRRVIRRRRHRKERIKHLILSFGLVSPEEMDRLLSSSQEKSVYELRVDALARALTPQEAVRLLIHFAQRRGYRSNSKSEEIKEGAETGKVKQAIQENRQRMAEKGYRTVGEMLWKDPLFKRVNPDGSLVLTVHNSPDDYKITVERTMLAEEIRLIFHTQRALGSTWAAVELEERYLDIWGSQRNFDEGPGGNSPYGGSLIESHLGRCTFEPDQPRAPKSCFTAERFRLLEFANKLKIVGHGFPAEFLQEDQRRILLEFAMTSPNGTYAQLRKKLGLSEDTFFNNLYYGENEAAKVEKKKLGLMPFYHTLRKALSRIEKNAVDTLSPTQLDEIPRILTLYKADQSRIEKLQELGLPERYFPVLLELSPSKAMHLSLSAMKKLLPYMEQGFLYDKACAQVYDSHTGSIGSATRSTKLSLEMIEEISNPVVRRAVSQAIKVINAIVRQYGPPEVVRIELARELSKPKKVRDQLEKKQQNNAAWNDEIRQQIQEYKKEPPTGQDIVKFKLFHQQNGLCLYSGKNLDLSRLFEPGYVDVDHIIPYSISFDDSYNNKVLVLTSENRQKGNRLPFEYFGHDQDRWHRFETLVDTQIRSFQKRNNLLCHTLSEEQRSGFKKRNLVDTQYLSTVLFHLIEDHLLFAETGNYKRKTQAVNGSITAHIRKRLGIEKVRANGHLHHAKDAAIVACVSPGMIQKITNFSKRRECAWTKEGYVDYETGELLTKEAYEEKYAPKFPPPWPKFSQELEARLSEDPRREIDFLHLSTYDSDEVLSPVFVSQAPNRKITGAAHEETIRSAKEPGGTVSKVPLSSLKLDNSGEIADYYRPEDDPLLYEALKARLLAFGGSGKHAFTEPFYKPKHNGQPGPLVKKVKLYKKATLTVPVGHGIAANGKMVRLDVFYVQGEGYYFVPLYTADTVKPDLPCLAVTTSKKDPSWKKMQEEDFLFSLYSGDLVRIVSSKGIKLNLAKSAEGPASLTVQDALLYYGGFNISTGALNLATHDGRYWQSGLGGKRLSLIEKYQVDVLGRYSRVSLPEKRMRFSLHGIS